jgi:hypothetical protein
VLVLVAVVAVVVWRSVDRTRLEEAAALAPAGSERLSWTDWEAVRRALDAEVGASSSPDEVVDFLDEGFERDLTNSSALLESAPAMHEELGLSPANLSWELLAQGPDGAVEVLGVGEDVDLEALADRLERLGFRAPASDSSSGGELDGGVWRGGGDLLARVGDQLTPELQHVAILEDEGLVLTSDRAAYLPSAVDVARGDADAVEGLDDVVEASGSAVSASVYTGGHACGELAMASADATDQEQAELLVEQAGGVDPMTGFAMSAQPGGSVRVAMSFADEDQAQANADSRNVLARGPAPGQGGTFGDRFTVSSATAEGSTVVLDLQPREGAYVLSDLSSGPVLFATC